MDELAYLLPREMLDEAEAEMGPLPAVELFNDPEHQGLFEKWCAGIFGLGYEMAVRPCDVGLNSSSTRFDVDFFLRANGRVFGFQVTEVQEPGRRRGREVRDPSSRPPLHGRESELRGRSEGPEWIREGVRRKAQRYRSAGSDLNILVYADFATDEMCFEAVANALVEFRSAFASIWVMDSVRVGSVHSFAELGQVRGWSVARPIEEYYGGRP